MKKESGAIIYSPSDLIHCLASPFAPWLHRYDLENPGAITPDQETEEKIVLRCRRRARARELHSFVIQRQSGSDHSCFVIFPVCPPPCLLGSPLICNQGEYPRQGAKARRRKEEMRQTTGFRFETLAPWRLGALA
jgi:hypothetical protein